MAGSLWVLAAAFVAAPADPPDAAELGKGLASLRVVAVDPDAKTVGYLPARVRPANSTGAEEKSLSRVDLPGGAGIVQGHLALAADPAEVRELEARVRKALPGRGVAEARPEAFGLALRRGKQVVWERPVAGGDPRRVPVQGTDAGAGDLGVDGLVVWVERLPAADAVVRLDMAAVVRAVETRFGVDAVVPLGEWTTLSAGLIESGAVTVAVRGGPGPARDVVAALVATHLQRVLTDEKAQPAPPPKAADKPKGDGANRKGEPQGGEPGLSLSVRVGYKVSKAGALKQGADTLNLSVSQTVRRSLPITGAVAVRPAGKS